MGMMYDIATTHLPALARAHAAAARAYPGCGPALGGRSPVERRGVEWVRMVLLT